LYSYVWPAIQVDYCEDGKDFMAGLFSEKRASSSRRCKATTGYAFKPKNRPKLSVLKWLLALPI
jgi:hypothetical protein